MDKVFQGNIIGDSTAMTIEFLRARLLSERSVSRAARQRADQLAKRVTELEEQLRLVTLQRKKAEKAASEVLTILESQGIGDLSDTINLSSDREELPCDDTVKEYESSTTSRMERSELEDGLSGSEPEVSNSQGRNLSWKSHSNSLDCHEKQRAKQIRQRQRRRSFISTLKSSPKHQLGLSCRKIKRKDMGSEADGETNKPSLLDAQSNGGIITGSNYCNDQLKDSVETSKGVMEEAVADTSDSHQIDEHTRATEVHYANERERDEVMERVLEQQAMLIGQFQAEEDAQREWEDKYNENKATLVNYNLGNCSCMAENCDQSKKDVAHRTPDYCVVEKLDVHISNSAELTSESLSCSENNVGSKEVSNVALSNGSIPREMIYAPTGSCSDASEMELVGHNDRLTVQETKIMSQEHAVSVPVCCSMIMDRKQNEMMLNNVYKNRYPSNSKLNSHGIGNVMLKDPSSRPRFPLGDQSKLTKLGHQPKDQIQLETQLPRGPSRSLGGVLEALQRAKLSLSQEIGKLPSRSQNMLAIAAPTPTYQTSAVTSVNGLDIPISSASLFRLPTDSFSQSHLPGPKFYRSESTFPANLPHVGYQTRPYGYENPITTSYMEGRSRISLGKQHHSDDHVNSSMVACDPNRYFRTHPDLSAERASFHNEFSNSYSDVRHGMSPGDRHFLYSGDRAPSDTQML